MPRSENGRSGRSVIAGSVVALAALGTVAAVAVAGTASAGPVPAAAPAATAVVRSGSPTSATDRVADFYGAYIDAVSGDTGGLPGDLRAVYLTRVLRARLAAWEARQHTDGVLRARDVPVKWSVSAADSATGHVHSTVTLTWGLGPHPATTHLTVVSDTRTHLITAITPTT